MSLMDNFRRNFGLGGDGKSGAKSNDDTAPPAGLNQKPDGGKFAAVLNKKPMVIGGTALGLIAVVGYIGFVGGSKHVTHSGPSRVVPGRQVNVSLPPPPKHRAKPKPASKPKPPKHKTPAHHAPPGHKTVHHATHTAPATQHARTPQEKAEKEAFSQGMSQSWRHANGGNTKNIHHKSSTSSGSKSAKHKNPASVYDANVERRPASPYELTAGADIPAVLTTAIQSNLPGQITAQVSRNVYDSESGAYLLIPAGAKLVGYYSNKVIAGQTRVGVEWTRIIMPNGASVSLGKMPGAGPSGKDGLHDLVNDHTWEIFKNALLMSVIDLGVSVSQPGYGSAGGYNQNTISPTQEGEASLMQTFGQAEGDILKRYTNIAPTLTIRAGYQLNVAVTKDIVFPGPYKAKPAYRGSATPGQPAPAAIPNPYSR